MDKTYSLNPQILPKAPISHKKYPYMADLAIVAVVGALILGLLYWWSIAPQATVTIAPVTVDKQAQAEARALSTLKSSVPTTSEQTKSVLAQLQKSKPVSNASTQSVMASLRAR